MTKEDFGVLYENTREIERMLSVLIKRLTEGSGKGAEGERDRDM